MTEPAVTLCEGGIADLDGVVGVMEDSFDPRYGEAWTPSQCAGLLPLAGVWLSLARIGDRIVGFALARTVANEAELLLLAVARDVQRRGIGKMLLERFAERASGAGAERLHLEVREGNHAVNLYEQAGFTLAGRRRNYYCGRDGLRYDALTFARFTSTGT